MSSWPSSKATRVLAALYRIGWSLKRQSGSHKLAHSSRATWTATPIGSALVFGHVPDPCCGGGSEASAERSYVAAGETRVSGLKCGTCRGAGFGGSDLVPRLAGQTTGSLIGQLEAFAAKRREHPPIETPFDKIGDIEAVAHYFTSLK